MNAQHKLVTFLSEILREEQGKSREVLAGYIVGELIGDSDNVYHQLLNDDQSVARIADLASDLEWSNGSEEQLNAMWQELKMLTEELRKK